MAFAFIQSLVVDPEEEEEEAESDIDLDLGSASSSDDDDGGEGDGDRARSSLSWSTELDKVSHKVGAFTELSGGIHDLPGDSDPLDYFQLFFPDQLVEEIVVETNRYAEQQQAAKGSRDPYWKPVTLDDIYKYFYINIKFGLIQLPETRLYWSSDPAWRVPSVADVMGRQRFQKINQYFHLVNSEQQPPRGAPLFDPLYKVRPLLDHVRHTCSAVYRPQRDISVDEAMVGYTGRLSFKQYIKSKPTPWGIKIWCCAEAHTGYVLNFSVYTGKSDDPSPHGLGYSVVMSMVEQYLERHHTVFYDNFFSSPQLAADLLEKKTYSCATIRPNRKEWPLPKSKQKRGDVRMRQKGMMVATQWTDKRQVNVLSTNSDPEMTTVQRRTKGGVVDVQIPAPVVSYNSGMLGVDLSDQHRSYYPVGRPGVKWWRYLVWYLMQVSIINSFLLMKSARPGADRTSPAGNHLTFRAQLAKALLERTSKAAAKRATESPSTAGTSRPASGEHRLSKMPGRQRRCFQCAADGIKMPSGRTREASTGCTLCNVHLHGGHCYNKFHENLKK